MDISTGLFAIAILCIVWCLHRTEQKWVKTQKRIGKYL